MPNILAYVVLLGWIPFTFFLFWKYPGPKAALISIIGGAMCLPERLSFDLPLLPPVDKLVIPAATSLVAALFWHGARVRAARPFRGVDGLFTILLLSGMMTVIGNQDVILWEGGGTLPGLTLYDYVSIAIRDLTEVFPLFLVGRALFTSRRDLYALATFLAAAGIVYSVPEMIEVRLSPQFHMWIYGFIPGDFQMMIRFGGYRPQVLMSHGINVARFQLGALLCMTALARLDGKIFNISSKAWVPYLMFILVLMKSAGAWVFGAIGVPIVMFTSAKTQVRVAIALALFVVIYPVLRAADALPIDAVIDWAAENVSEERASSLGDRFEQEDLLLDKFGQRFWFGWGPGIRYSVYDARLNNSAVVDGEWLHNFGRRGMIGFLCVYCMHLAPIWMAFRTIGKLQLRDARVAAGMTLMSAIYTFDLIPNSTGTLPQLFISGALYGAIRGVSLQTQEERRAQLRANSQRTAQPRTAEAGPKVAKSRRPRENPA